MGKPRMITDRDEDLLPQYKDQVRAGGNRRSAEEKAGSPSFEGPDFKDQARSSSGRRAGHVRARALDRRNGFQDEDETLHSTIREGEGEDTSSDPPVFVPTAVLVEPEENLVFCTLKNVSLLLLCSALVAGVVIGGVCASGMCSSVEVPEPETTRTSSTSQPINVSPTTSSPSFAPSASPTSENLLRGAVITPFINNITFSSENIVYPLQGTPSPEDRALAWIIEKDPLRLSPETDASRLQQRYALLTLWFQSNQETDPWTLSAGWLTAENECVWNGITCVDGFVTEIDLRDNNLRGSIPPDMALLSFVYFVVLEDNKMSGSLPTSLGEMTRLASLWVDDNRLTGKIPTEMGSCTDMYSFWVEGNSMTGSIPSELGRWTSIYEFSIHENAFDGSLPSEIGNWVDVGRVSVHTNSFGGSLPTEIGMWSPGPYYFSVRTNSFSGTIPESAGENWTIIENAHFFDNEFSGSMPLCNVTGQLTADCEEVDCPCCTHCCPGDLAACA